MASGAITRSALRSLDWLAAALHRAPRRIASAATGERGEEAAYFYLRKLGYVMVARNYRSPRRRGEIDLIGWEKDVLCFIEVKTRSASTQATATAESAVDGEKQRELAGMAREYLRRIPGAPATRFDVVSIYVADAGEGGGAAPQITLFRNAFAVA